MTVGKWHILISKDRLNAYLLSQAERYAAERREARQVGEHSKGDRLLGAEQAVRQLRIDLR